MDQRFGRWLSRCRFSFAFRAMFPGFTSLPYLESETPLYRESIKTHRAYEMLSRKYRRVFRLRWNLASFRFPPCLYINTVSPFKYLVWEILKRERFAFFG